MLEDTSLYCSSYCEEKPEKKNESGTLYSKYNGVDGILIKNKPGKLQKLVRSSQRVLAKIFIFRGSAPAENATRNKSIPFPKWEDQNGQRHSVLTSDVDKGHENKAKTCLFFPRKFKKKNSQWNRLHWEGNCALSLFFLLLGLTNFLFSRFKNWFLKFALKRFPLHAISQSPITAKNSSYFLRACAL